MCQVCCVYPHDHMYVYVVLPLNVSSAMDRRIALKIARFPARDTVCVHMVCSHSRGVPPLTADRGLSRRAVRLELSEGGGKGEHEITVSLLILIRLKCLNALKHEWSVCSYAQTCLTPFKAHEKHIEIPP